MPGMLYRRLKLIIDFPRFSWDSFTSIMSSGVSSFVIQQNQFPVCQYPAEKEVP